MATTPSAQQRHSVDEKEDDDVQQLHPKTISQTYKSDSDISLSTPIGNTDSTDTKNIVHSLSSIQKQSRRTNQSMQQQQQRQRQRQLYPQYATENLIHPSHPSHPDHPDHLAYISKWGLSKPEDFFQSDLNQSVKEEEINHEYMSHSEDEDDIEHEYEILSEGLPPSSTNTLSTTAMTPTTDTSITSSTTLSSTSTPSKTRRATTKIPNSGVGMMQMMMETEKDNATYHSGWSIPSTAASTSLCIGTDGSIGASTPSTSTSTSTATSTPASALESAPETESTSARINRAKPFKSKFNPALTSTATRTSKNTATAHTAHTAHSDKVLTLKPSSSQQILAAKSIHTIPDINIDKDISKHQGQRPGPSLHIRSSSGPIPTPGHGQASEQVSEEISGQDSRGIIERDQDQNVNLRTSGNIKKKR